MNNKNVGKIIVIGLGNVYRCDDGIGIMIARRLKEKFPRELLVIEESADLTRLIDVWNARDVVFLVDAVSSQGVPGKIYRFDLYEDSVQERLFRASTHAFSVVQLAQLARLMGRSPSKMILYGVEAKNFNQGEEISPELNNVIHKVVNNIQEEISILRSGGLHA